ncbi:MAG: tyrosine-type recombinase/integrase [Phycisphaeraceae bacterium]|nr:tyrosine-type recombinase/integrase [Phycisphaeraceae bacterium]
MPAHTHAADLRSWRIRRKSPGPVEAYLKTLSPASHRTIRQALDKIACMVCGVEKGQIDALTFRWEKLSRADTLELARRLDDQLAPRSVNKMLSALRGVLRACRQQGLIDERRYQAVAGFEMVKAGSVTESRMLSDAEVNKLLKQAQKDDSASGLRDAAILAIYLCCGPRRSELVALDRTDYAPAPAPGSGQLTIRGSRKERHRTVTLDDRARRALDRWLAVIGDDSAPLLRAVTKGGLIRKTRMTDQAVYDGLRKLAVGADLPGVRSRDLRRTAVVKMIQQGMDLDQVQHVVGQTSWLTPAAYRELVEEAEGTRSQSSSLPARTKPDERRLRS